MSPFSTTDEDRVKLFSLIIYHVYKNLNNNKNNNKYSWMLRHSIPAIDHASLNGAV